MQLERWKWRCEHARCGSDIGDRDRMIAIANMHHEVSGHATFVESYALPPTLPALPSPIGLFPRPGL